MRLLYNHKFISVIFIIWSVIVSIFLYSYKEYRVEKILESQMKINNEKYTSANRYYKLLSENINRYIVNSKDTMEILKQLKDATPKKLDAIRKKLHNHLKISYQSLEDIDIKILHFHLKNNHSFLRMHKPESFDDDLSDVRYGIKVVNQALKPMDGLEVGPAVSGFRFIFPIVDEEKNHLGSVEVSVRPQGFIDVIRDNSIQDIHFLIKKSIVNEKLWDDQFDKHYIVSPESSLYYLENIKEMYKNTHNKIIEDDKKLKSKIAKNIHLEKPFAIYHNEQTISFLPLRTIQNNEKIAYFVLYRGSKDIENIIFVYWVLNIINIFIVVTFLYILRKDFLYKKFTNSLNKELSLKVQEELQKNKKLRQQSKLSQMKDIINSIEMQEEDKSLNDVFDKITQVSASALNVSRVSIWLYNKSKTNLECLNIYSKEDDSSSSEIVIEHKNYPQYFKEIDSGKTISIENLENNYFTKEYLENYLNYFNIKSLLDIPIIVEGKVVGVLCNEQIDTTKKWTKTEIDFSKAIAGSISISMQMEHKKEIGLLLKEKTKEQDILLSLFDKGDSVLFKWKNDEHWSTVYVSKSVKSLLGYDTDDFILNNIFYDSCIHHDDIKTVTQEIQHASLSNEDFFKHKPYRVITKHGNTKWVIDYSMKIKDSYGIITHYIGYITDITDIRRKEKQLLQQSKLVQMGEMIGMIAHQWRQPLNAISATGINLSLLSSMNMLKEDKVQESSEFIQEQCQKMSSTIDTFMNFVKPAKISKPFTLLHTVNAIMQIMGTQLSNHNIEVNINSSNEHISVVGYEDLLEQVIINILSNARDSFENLEMAGKFINITIYMKGSSPIISIEDNAGGIPDNVKDKIFNPYFTTKEQGKGTGIGLYMSMDIMKKSFDGNLVYIATDSGSCFKIICGKGG